MTDFPGYAQRLRGLSELHSLYTDQVSAAEWALSKEAAATLICLSQDQGLSTVLDLGSGFSSASMLSAGLDVTSYDHDPAWCEKTKSFLRGRGLASESVKAVTPGMNEELGDRTFDLVTLDINHTNVRARYLPAAWDRVRPGGYLYVDDVHVEAYKDQVEAFFRGEQHDRVDVTEQTLDSFGRFGWLIRKPEHHEERARPRICLNMIVKNEGKVIERCLHSIKPYIDEWVIVDTGSTDDTIEKIHDVLHDLPGEVHSRPWVSFGHNRNEALDLARGRGDYLLFVDASFEWEAEPDFEFPLLTADSYLVRTKMSGTSWWMTYLARSDLPWRYQGDSHAVLVCDHRTTRSRLDGVAVLARGDGARRSGTDPKRKYRRDVELFSAALEKNPEDRRSMFYLAQAYRDLGDLASALVWYDRRAEAGGWPEEVWYSLYQVGKIHHRLGNHEHAEHAYLCAFRARPTRAEPLVALAALHREHKQHELAFIYASYAAQMTRPDDILFLEDAVYDWMALDAFALSAFYTGRTSMARALNLQLLKRIPDSERARVEKNLAFCQNELSHGAAKSVPASEPPPPSPTRPPPGSGAARGPAGQEEDA